MKLIIDIPEDTYERVMNPDKFYRDIDGEKIRWAVYKGAPIPDNATNGDVVKAMFPDAEIHIDGNDVFFHHIGFWIKCNIRWWNASYQKGGKG